MRRSNKWRLRISEEYRRAAVFDNKMRNNFFRINAAHNPKKHNVYRTY